MGILEKNYLAVNLVRENKRKVQTSKARTSNITLKMIMPAKLLFPCARQWILQTLLLEAFYASGSINKFLFPVKNGWQL